jgi:hemoglobin
MLKEDIKSKEDIKLLVDSFYIKVRGNALLANVFDTTMQVNWEKHLPKMYEFWEFILWQTGNYKNAPFPVHEKVNEKIALTPLHFDTWISLFNETVDALYEGTNAVSIKQKAQNIKAVWSYKFNYKNKVEDSSV